MNQPSQLLLISDSHGTGVYVRELLKQFPADRKPDAVLFAGDGAGIEHQLKHLSPVYGVKGNCDEFSSLPLEMTLVFSGQKLYLTHGHRQRVKRTLDLLASKAFENEAAIAVYGHTHRQGMDMVNRVICINPGALWQGEYALLTLELDGRVKPSFHRFI